MSVPKYKDKSNQLLYEAALKLEYPVSFIKDGIGGSLKQNWNLGYEGVVTKPPRASRTSQGYVMFYAGKEKRKIDNYKTK